MLVIKQFSLDNWNDFLGDSNYLSSLRLFDNKLSVSFNKINPPYNYITPVARYRFGENYNNGIAACVTNTEGVGPNLSISQNVNFVQDGCFFDKSSYLFSSSGSSFNYPSSSCSYLSFWFKSNTKSYDSNTFMCGYHKGNNIGDIAFSIMIQDNKIYGVVDTVSSRYFISPVGGDVFIDTEWHHAILYIGKNTLSQEFMFVIDNNIDIIEPISIINSVLIGNNNVFSIGGSPYFSGFNGTIDEVVFGTYVGNGSSSINLIYSDMQYYKRFINQIVLSPVISLEEENILDAIKVNYNNSSSSNLKFSFRSSDTVFTQTDNVIEWTNFSFDNEYVTNVLEDVSSYMYLKPGKYFQFRMLFNPSNPYSNMADDLYSETPEIEQIALYFDSPSQELNPCVPFFIGRILSQKLHFSELKTIYKLSINLLLDNQEKTDYILNKSTNISFPVCSFSSIRDGWIFSLVDNILLGYSTHSVSIKNINQIQTYNNNDDIYNYAPKISYKIYFPEEGNYDFWGYGVTDSEGLFYSFNNDKDNLINFTLGLSETTPKWTFVSSIYIKEGGVYNFDIYISTSYSSNNIILDQWLFTKNYNLRNELDFVGNSDYKKPFNLTRCPFSVACNMYDNSHRSLSFLPSVKINDSGKYFFNIYNGQSYIDDVYIELQQIGGTKKFKSSWIYSDQDTVNTNNIYTIKPYLSEDFGQNFSEL